MTKISVVNGPNINVLEKRSEIYGGKSLRDIENLCTETAKNLNMRLDFFQSNHEGEIIDYIQKIDSDGLVINAAGYSHTSIAILDSLLMIKVPIIEVHMSNIFAREEFRKHSYVSQVALAVISGVGIRGYKFAIEYLQEVIKI